jgi:pimeloyl-ACP methyl ester carboxylesterase
MWDSFADWKTVVQALRVPTLLITGVNRRGALVTPSMARQCEALSTRIHTVRIPGAGHNIRRENYPAYMRALRQFLSTLA